MMILLYLRWSSVTKGHFVFGGERNFRSVEGGRGGGRNPNELFLICLQHIRKQNSTQRFLQNRRQQEPYIGLSNVTAIRRSKQSWPQEICVRNYGQKLDEYLHNMSVSCRGCMHPPTSPNWRSLIFLLENRGPYARLSVSNNKTTER